MVKLYHHYHHNHTSIETFQNFVIDFEDYKYTVFFLGVTSMRRELKWLLFLRVTQ